MRRIAGSSFMITDSFHGVAFSIIYKKQFCAILNHNGRDSRMVSLLSLLNLKDRMFNNVEEMMKTDSWLAPIDYAKVEKDLYKLRKQSIDYLLNALD